MLLKICPATFGQKYIGYFNLDAEHINYYKVPDEYRTTLGSNVHYSFPTYNYLKNMLETSITFEDKNK